MLEIIGLLSSLIFLRKEMNYLNAVVFWVEKKAGRGEGGYLASTLQKVSKIRIPLHLTFLGHSPFANLCFFHSLLLSD